MLAQGHIWGAQVGPRTGSMQWALRTARPRVAMSFKTEDGDGRLYLHAGDSPCWVYHSGFGIRRCKTLHSIKTDDSEGNMDTPERPPIRGSTAPASVGPRCTIELSRPYRIGARNASEGNFWFPVSVTAAHSWVRAPVPSRQPLVANYSINPSDRARVKKAIVRRA